MPRDTRTITAEDIMPIEQYEMIRKDKKAEAIERKKLSRLSVGPNAVILFENWDSMWLQIQEMLRIEKGGEEQLADELAAYDPMVPKGMELTATVLFEVADPVQRDAFLRTIGGVEDHISIRLGDHVIPARPEGDVERTRRMYQRIADSLNIGAFNTYGYHAAIDDETPDSRVQTLDDEVPF